MRFPRASGILLHPTSLPGPSGIGELGPEARRFANFLFESGQRIWQVLPLGPTGYGDSPYQCFSAFAGNPLLISLDGEESGLPEHQADYGRVIRWKLPRLRRFEASAEFDRFCEQNQSWLDDYALFAALKDAHGGEAIWTRWEPDIARREPGAMARWSERLAEEVRCRKYWQFLFFQQWNELKRYCHERGIRIMGDMPIYVAHDSADVWANPELFCLDDAGNPALVAGVPPDYFSATGQLWGNPIYRWDVLAAQGYRWWIERFRATLDLFDMVRVDHFRGFEAYWRIPAGETTAIHGEWVKGPGAALFEAVRRALGELPIVAENLGVITPDVEAIRNQFDFPGMSILQFAFGRDPQGPDFRPHNYPRNRVAYSGTHDNDTTVGWWNSAGIGDSTRTPEDVVREMEFARRYLATDGREVHWDFIRALMASVADTVLFPLQDVLGLGSEARMNIPATRSGNWRFRFTADMLTPAMQDRLRTLAVTYDR